MLFHEQHVYDAAELPLPQGLVLEPAPESLPQALRLGPQALRLGPQVLEQGPQVLGLKLGLVPQGKMLVPQGQGPQPQGKVLQELPELQAWPAGSSDA